MSAIPVSLDSFTSSTRQIVVTAKAPGVSSLILWDQAGQSATYLVFSDLDVANLQREIEQALPGENITCEGGRNIEFLSPARYRVMLPPTPRSSWRLCIPRMWSILCWYESCTRGR